MIILGGIVLSLLGFTLLHFCNSKLWTCCNEPMIMINEDKDCRYCKKCGFTYRSGSCFD
jgi:hypothetical protein